MARKTKNAEIEELKVSVEFYKGLYEERIKRDSQLAESRDEEFAISPHRFQLEDRLAFFKKMYNLENSLYDSLKLQMHRRVQDLTEKQLQELLDSDTAELLLDYPEFRLKDQVLELTAKVENRDETIEILMAQIEEYRKRNAVLESQMEYLQINQPAEYRAYIESLQSEGSILRNQYNQLLLSYNMLLTLFSDEQLKNFSVKGANLIRDKVNQIIQKLPKPDQPEKIKKESDYFSQEEKAKLTEKIKLLEDEISRLSAVEPAKSGRPTTISESDVRKMAELREQNYSYRKIANMMGCSVGTVYRLISK